MKGIGAVVTTYKTVTLEDANCGVNTYNHGTDGCVKNPDLDVRRRRSLSFRAAGQE